MVTYFLKLTQEERANIECLLSTLSQEEIKARIEKAKIEDAKIRPLMNQVKKLLLEIELNS